MSGPGRVESRTPQRILEHYEIERELADRLRRAGKKERRGLYAAVYDELFQRVPDHPQLTRKSSPQESRQIVGQQMRFLASRLTADTNFLEVGPGDCALSVEVARIVKQVYAVDVSDEISRRQDWPANLCLIFSDGSSVPVPPGSVDVAYSNHLMEHLHPDDAREHLAGLYRALVPGGVYICITPNRLSGPHDISHAFDRTSTGFHLKEYTVGELADLFRWAGFSQVRVMIGARRRSLLLPVWLVILGEYPLRVLPFRWQRRAAYCWPYRLLLDIRLVAAK